MGGAIAGEYVTMPAPSQMGVAASTTHRRRRYQARMVSTFQPGHPSCSSPVRIVGTSHLTDRKECKWNLRGLWSQPRKLSGFDNASHTNPELARCSGAPRSQLFEVMRICRSGTSIAPASRHSTRSSWGRTARITFFETGTEPCATAIFWESSFVHAQ